jgi:hypothetical protein
MKFVKAIAIVIAAVRLLLLSSAAQAFDFENICPTQAPPEWGALAWMQFRDACITNGVGRPLHRDFWETCINTCVSANHAEGRTILPKPAQPENQSTTSGTPLNPNWCPDVPASTPPLNKISPEEWASVRHRCMNEATAVTDEACVSLCEGARELWVRASDAAQASIPEKPPQNWTAEGETQGQWTALREHCVALFGEVVSVGTTKPLPPFSPADWENCQVISGPPTQPLTYPVSTDKLQGPFPLQGGAKGWVLPVPSGLATPAAH